MKLQLLIEEGRGACWLQQGEGVLVAAVGSGVGRET
jgi:hypothetical protein